MTHEISVDSFPETVLDEVFWERGELDYKLDKLQLSMRATINATSYDKVCILSSRQIGKSYLACVLAIEFCLQNPGTIVRILSASIKQVSDIVNDNLSKIVLDAPPGLIERHKSEYRWRVGSSTLRLGALERANVDSNRGGNASLLIFEECGFVASADYAYAIDSVLGPQLLRSGGREIHISTPSEDEFHHLHDVIRPQCEAHGTFFKYDIYQSPSISREQIQKAIERCGGDTTETFKREYLAEVSRSSSLMVIPEYDENKHVRGFEIPQYYKAAIVWDLGGVMDKTAILCCIWDWQSARLLVWDEAFFEENTPTRPMVAASRALDSQLNWGEGGPMIWADVPPQMTNDFWDLYQYNVATPPKDDREAQINALRLMFINGKIIIHERCKMLRGALKVGRYNNRRSDFERHRIFGHCDPIMALVYANRVIDKTTLPIPERTINREKQFLVPNRNRTDARLEEISRVISPYNPLKNLHKS